MRTNTPAKTRTGTDRHGDTYVEAVIPRIASQRIRVDRALKRDALDAALAMARADTGFLSMRNAIFDEMEARATSAMEGLYGQLGRERAARAHALLVESGDQTNLDLNAAHAILLEGDSHLSPGTVRDVPVWIGGLTRPSAAYVPPSADRVPALLADLDLYVQDMTGNPVVRAVVAHAQFESIHPYRDGNGRIGRSLTSAVLRRNHVTLYARFPISVGLMHRKREYIEGLIAFRGGDASPLIRLHVEAIHDTLASVAWVTEQLRVIRERWEDALSGVRSDALARTVIPRIIARPRVALTDIVSGGASQAAGYNAISTLETAGILVREHGGWAVPEVEAAITRAVC